MLKQVAGVGRHSTCDDMNIADHIVKSFEDPDFLAKLNYKEGCWHWGLGDDGRLYYQTSYWGTPKAWVELAGHCYNLPIGIGEMRRILKEFEKWLVWL